MQETLVRFLGQEDPLRKDRWPIPVFLGFACGLVGKESICSVGDLDSISGLGRYPGGGRLPTSVFWPGEFHGQSMGLQRVGHDWTANTFTLLLSSSIQQSILFYNNSLSFQWSLLLPGDENWFNTPWKILLFRDSIFFIQRLSLSASCSFPSVMEKWKNKQKAR